jgi:hypothetical protein
MRLVRRRDLLGSFGWQLHELPRRPHRRRGGSFDLFQLSGGNLRLRVGGFSLREL